jgi:hypothetical protein
MQVVHRRHGMHRRHGTLSLTKLKASWVPPLREEPAEHYAGFLTLLVASSLLASRLIADQWCHGDPTNERVPLSANLAVGYPDKLWYMYLR